MNRQSHAKVLALPVARESSNEALTLYPDPPKLIAPPVQLDSWVGPCDSCGYAVFSGDDYELQEDKPVCPECISEQAKWFVPAVKKVA